MKIKMKIKMKMKNFKQSKIESNVKIFTIF